MPYREAAKMATITRSITLDAIDAANAIREWIEKHHPAQELDRATLHIEQVTKGVGANKELLFNATWTVTKEKP
jgi:hypothetical protein